MDQAQLRRLLPEFAKAGVRELKLNNTDFTEVDIGLLTQTIPNLVFLDLTYSRMKKDQLISLLFTIKHAENLQELDLCGIDLSFVSLTVLKESICNVRKVSLERNFLNKLYEVSVVKECLPSSKLRCLHLHHLKMVSLQRGISIYSEHFNSIEATMLLEMVKNNSTVKELTMTGEDLSTIDEEILFQTVLNLKSVSFVGTHLTTEQLTRIVSAAILSDSLESLNLSSNNLSDLSSEQLVTAAERLNVLGLESTRLTHEQCIAVIGGATTSPTLRFLNLKMVVVEKNYNEVFEVLKEAKKREDLYIIYDHYIDHYHHDL
eukprot:GFUD01040429.1.p1 GENE.GFUD01040429.1~~GFUD01040429.1.p1  ORF type:complete len:363 (-),score=90.04 GFUD01040429.1:77-1030(-)